MKDGRVRSLLGRRLTLNALTQAFGVSHKTAANACAQIKGKARAESARALIRIAINNQLC